MPTNTALIVAGCPIATVTLYRCLHLQEQLTVLGHQVRVRPWHEIEDNTDAILGVDLVILQRVPFTLSLAQSIKRARGMGGRILFDTDDLIFEPALIQQHRAVQQLPAAEQELYAQGVRRYAATLEACDAVLVSTPLLADLARRRGRPAFVHANGLGREMTAVAAQSTAIERTSNGTVMIGYGSGTHTHDIDFTEAVPALLSLMARYPQVHLTIAGPLVLPQSLSRFQSRIRRLPLMSWQEWLKTAATFSINLAPLERNNLFCAAKSAIKWLEAGSVGVPTVASATEPFVRAICHGETGHVAETTADWIESLEALVVDPGRRHQIGAAARQAVLHQHGIEARTHQLAKILDQVMQPQPSDPSAKSVFPLSANGSARPPASPSPHRDPAVSSAPAAVPPLVINWILTDPIPGGGGTTNIIRLINHLTMFGHVCHVYVQAEQHLRHADSAEIEQFLREHWIVHCASVRRFTGIVEDADATIATYWATAYTVANIPNSGHKYYLVQDHEVLFYPMGMLYVQAEESYKLGLHCLTLGHWLADLMQKQYGAQADPFDFAVDHAIYSPAFIPEPNRPLRVVFYARPSTPRRGYELGIEALRRVHAQRPDVDIVLYGADSLPHPPNFLHHNVGILVPHELSRLYATSDVGVVISLTNPSLTPLEMMACGCAVVDIDSERVAGLLHNGENCLLAQPTPESIADAVLRLLNDADLRRNLVRGGFERVKDASWETSARQIEDVLLRHAPAEQRLWHRRQQENEADLLVWQIHQLLDRWESRPSLVAPSRDWETHLAQSAEEVARTTAQLDATAEQLHREFGRSGTHHVLAALRRMQRRLLSSGRARLDDLPLRVHELGEQPLHQRFRVMRSHLCRIELLPATPVAVATRPLHVTLRLGDATGPVVAEQVYRAAEIEPDRPLVFAFAPQPHSYQQLYLLTLATPQVTPSDCHAFWLFKHPLHTDAALRQGDRSLPGALAMQWFCCRQDERIAAEEPRAWGEAVRPMPNRVQSLRSALDKALGLAQKTAQTMGREGIGGLGQSARQYVQWRLDLWRERRDR